MNSKPRKLKTLILASLLVCLVQAGYAQEITIKGIVTTHGRIPLNNVSIILKNSGHEFFSDSTGGFMFKCDKKEKLTINALGFYSEKLRINDYLDIDTLHVNLRFKKGEKNFKLATANRYISAENLNHAIAHLESGPDYGSYRTILDAIQGRVSGVSVTSNAIYIRGNNSLNSGSIPALLVIDGAVVEFSVFVNLPPIEVRSIRVIKDAAASSLYGARGMGGVIEVKTKSQN